MAEGWYHFDNHAFDNDDHDIDDKRPLVPTDFIKRDIINHAQNLSELKGVLKNAELAAQKERLVKAFYAEVYKRYNIEPTNIDYKTCSMLDDVRTLYWVIGDKEIKLNTDQGRMKCYALPHIGADFNKVFKSKGTSGVRTLLNLRDFDSKTRAISQSV